jgi:hypothetical protein
VLQLPPLPEYPTVRLVDVAWGVLLAVLAALPQVIAETSAAADTVPIAVIASVIGWLVATALQQRATRHQSGWAPAS